MEHMLAMAAWISLAARLLTGIACLLPTSFFRRVSDARRSVHRRRDDALLLTNLWMVVAFGTWVADVIIQA
ncbi:hypothetical protein [Robbsia andropogonis]|uniref:hypothetical protein n=1 Tax=Robbsia andropogonis TaxID=28092 RepID=UPI002A6A2A71|nr:hypothetical protein [Robbsia andropogonis]